MAIFETKNLTFTYPNCSNNAINDVSISISKGEFILLMGKTGSGKSTLLKHFVKDISPVGSLSGEILINANIIGYVPQNPENTFVSELVRGELAFALENQGMTNNEIGLKIAEIASFFNLNNKLDRSISTLSGGEKAIVAIASAMINNASAIILDEPTAWLDVKAYNEFVNILKRINQELGVSIIISSHSSYGVIELCDRLVIMEKGNIIFNDLPKKIDKALIDYLPLSARLFDEMPLNVKGAIPLADGKFKEKPLEKSNDDIAIEVKNITFAYGKNERDILDCLSMKIYNKKINAVIGANGSGKTTLLKLIAGIKKAYSGKIKNKYKVAYLPQNVKYLFTKDTVYDEIGENLAAKFGIEDALDRHPLDLSGGQMQKLALAILSKQAFDVLLLDEPTRGLDNESKNQLINYLKALNKTVVLVSHDLDFVGDVADYVSFLADGIIQATGNRRTVLSSLDFYTTEFRRITKSYLSTAVALEDVV